MHVWDFGNFEKRTGRCSVFLSPPKKVGFEVIEIAQKVVESTASESGWFHAGLFLLFSRDITSPAFSYSYLFGSGRFIRGLMRPDATVRNQRRLYTMCGGEDTHRDTTQHTQGERKSRAFWHSQGG